MPDFQETNENGENLHYFTNTFDPSFLEIEESLGVKIIDVQRNKKIYGSNSNIFFIYTISADNVRTTYLLKFGRNKNFDDELKGDLCIQGLFNSPKIVLSSKKITSSDEWILYEYIPGRLMSEEFTIHMKNNKLDEFYGLEEKKELHLYRLHSKTLRSIDYSEYINSRTNKLFRNRLLESTYKEFYTNSDKNISSLFNREIVLNGNTLPTTVDRIVKDIKDKYKADYPNKITGIVGHGDAHHGNIIIDNDIWFIDNEYADVTTPLMELAKPYYNDFLGRLFFHEQESLMQHFKITSYVDTGTVINMSTTLSKTFNEYLELTKIKLKTRKDTVNQKTVDFLSLNEYLFLCHILTKNPNKYPDSVQRIFILFAILLSIFDPYNPESIFSFFDEN